MCRTFAVIPAAGHSRRMGRPKLALPLGERTVLEHVVTALRQAGVELVLVVIGPHVPELAPLAERAGARVLALPEATPEMRATVEAGLYWLEEQVHPVPDERWLLVPADHPCVDPGVVRLLREAADRQPERSIFIPTHAGRRGHPASIAWKHVASIRAFERGQGLNAYLRTQAAETVEVPVAMPSICWDLDTMEDYHALLQRLGL
jgi:molybdenum cofactor cytidylyltransferase